MFTKKCRAIAVIVLLSIPLSASGQSLDVNTYLERARAALRSGQFEDAAKAAKQGLALKKTFALYCNLGVAQVKLKQSEAALNSFRSCKQVAQTIKSKKATGALKYAVKTIVELENELMLTKREYVVESTPSGAFFYVDQKGRGTNATPHRMWLTHGVHRLIFEPTGLPKKEVLLKVEKGPVHRLRVSLTTNIFTGSTLAVSSLPKGANLVINGRSYGKTPKTLPVKPGRYTIMVGHKGYEPFEKRISVAKGAGPQKVNAVLVAKHAKSGVSVAVSDGAGGASAGTIWPWVTVGVGAALSGAGVYFYVDGNNAAQEWNDANKKPLFGGEETKWKSQADYEKAREDAEGERSLNKALQTTFLVTGGGLIVGGVVWGILEMMDSGPKEASGKGKLEWHITPTVGEVMGVQGHVRF